MDWSNKNRYFDAQENEIEQRKEHAFYSVCLGCDANVEQIDYAGDCPACHYYINKCDKCHGARQITTASSDFGALAHPCPKCLPADYQVEMKRMTEGA
jgi:Zn finger protein HypA/HybF involved in hydrogenase expression